MIKRMFMLCCLFAFAVMGPAGVQAEVQDFTIVGPHRVFVDSVFKITVIENDANGRPMAPGTSEQVTLSATNDNGDPLTITPPTFQASGDGYDDVHVTLSGVPHETQVYIHAEGYGLTGLHGPNGPPVIVLDGQSVGGMTDEFDITAPSMANPNEPFPIYLTPVERIDGDFDLPSAFTGEIRLYAEQGNITPDSIYIDVAAGESHCVYVTLDAIAPNISIHARFPGGGGEVLDGYSVSFKNRDQAQISNSSDFTVHPTVYLDDTPLVVFGVTTESVWESTLWPVHGHNGDDVGWHMLTRIAGPGGIDLQFHTMLAPGSAPRDSLPGDLSFWSPQPLTIVLDQTGWELESGSDPFPDGLAGDYWVRRTRFSDGTAGTMESHSTFVFDSPMFDGSLWLVNEDGSREDTPDTLSKYSIDQLPWDATIWGVPNFNNTDTTYHMIATFQAAVDEEGGQTPVETETVWAYMTFTPSSRQPGPGDAGGSAVPDDIWNANFLINQANDFIGVQGDPLPPGLDGSFWVRFGVFAAPNGDGDDVGWSNHINTTGEQVYPTTLQVKDTHGRPGGIATTPVILQNDDGQDIAGLQFDIMSSGGADFQGAINYLENQGFDILSSNPEPGVTRILVVGLGGAILPPGQHVLMQLIYELDEGLNYGDTINLDINNAVLSDPDANPVPLNIWNGNIHIGRKGDLAGNDGQIDITDLVHMIGIILGQTPGPDPESFGYILADMNDDGSINILDAVRMINIILGRATSKQIAGPVGEAQLELGDMQVTTGGQQVIPIRAQFDGAVAGLQFTMTYDPAVVTIGEALSTPHLEGMTIQQYGTPGMLRIVIYSAEGKTIQASDLGTLLNLPVEILGRTGGMVSIGEAVVADPQAQAVYATLSNSTVKVSLAPDAFALTGNAPNPFNPSTRIAYEVPQQARITLTVFNILGQEVVRLVDEVQTPGRYVVNWAGRNLQGLPVSSGVYLYRLTSSTGYTETRRMTLLK